MKEKYVKLHGKWHNVIFGKDSINEYKWFTDNDALLLKLGKETENLLLKRNNRKMKPILIIIDGVDGVGKTTIVKNLIKKFKESGLKVVFNTFK